MRYLLLFSLLVPLLPGWAAEEEATAAFAELVADFEDHERVRDPIRAGRDGDLEAAARWPDVSRAAVKQRREAEAGFNKRLGEIDPRLLDAHDQTSYSVLEYLLDFRVELAEFDTNRIGFTNDSGFFTLPTQVAASTRLRAVDQVEAWIARLKAIPDFFDAHVEWLRTGVETGFVQPDYVVEAVLEQVRALAAVDADEHPLLEPLQQLPSRIPESDRDRLREAALEAIAGRALPAYHELAGFLQNEYLAEPRTSIGISEVSDGRDYYRALVRYHTTLETTPEAVHERGHAEVERIRAEMEEVISETGFEGSFAEFLEYLRTDPKFYARTEEELLMRAAWIAKRADDAMPRFFSRLPRLPYGVRPVPATMAPNYTTGRYWPGDLENGIAGGYMVNTYALDQRPLYELPALTLHEAVPGHHHQGALAQELEDVPEFRRRTYITAFGEGWALYTEHLGIEMGIYTTPYEHFGRLTYEMWRACRLVVDTGIHYFGWSREQAEACLLENSALAPHNVRTEIARYISWPGQALAYKTGELLIRDLRAEAEKRLGPDFDLRVFHDRILDEGAMPLTALESKMKAWIKKQAALNTSESKARHAAGAGNVEVPAADTEALPEAADGGALASPERRVLDSVDLDGLVETLCGLIAFESLGNREIPIQEHLAGLLQSAGMETDLWEIDLPALKRHPAYGAEIERHRALGLAGRWGHGGGPRLILNGHVDVVPAGQPERWSVPPFAGTVRAGKVYGRGAADMKGGLCCALYAVRALATAGVEIDGEVMIQPVAGEEDGGMGTLAAIERGHSADAAIVLEPTGLAVAPAQAGALSFRISIPGKAAHGALRAEGVDPLDKFDGILRAIRELERRRNERLKHPLFADYEIPFAICIGRVHAGVWASTVAETLVLEGRFGLGIGEDADSARRELEEAIDRAARRDEWLREHPPAVEWWGARYLPADIPPDHALVQTLIDSFATVSGKPPSVRGMPYGADMHLLVHQGKIPTVIFGPGDVRRAHAPDEFVPIAELETATRVLALTILRFCAA